MIEVLLNINTRAYDFWRIALEEWTAIAFSRMNEELRVVFQFLENKKVGKTMGKCKKSCKKRCKITYSSVLMVYTMVYSL